MTTTKRAGTGRAPAAAPAPRPAHVRGGKAATSAGPQPAAIVIEVYGTPAPQGSKKHVGRGIMVEMSKRLAPWREAVKDAALRAIDVYNGRTPLLLDGPQVVEFCFTVNRPKSAPKSRVHPDRTPDLSKLIRATEDALTDAGVWVDDARIVGYHQARKVYTGSADADALPLPGAVIRVWEVGT